MSSSTSFPRGALATKSTSTTCFSSFMMRSPPRSPSVKTVISFSLEICIISGAADVPPTATAFLMPFLRRVITSALPSQSMMLSEVGTSMPAERPLYLIISALITQTVIHYDVE